MSGNYVINIGRQLGSGGKEIGEKLAARLGINFYDKELINLASEESGLCKEFFEKAEKMRPPDNDSAIMRWNTCARLIMRYQLTPSDEKYVEPPLE